ncbi:MAG: hypothetical protein ABI382_11510 [Nakamurella sp.]
MSLHINTNTTALDAYRNLAAARVQELTARAPKSDTSASVISAATGQDTVSFTHRSMSDVVSATQAAAQSRLSDVTLMQQLAELTARQIAANPSASVQAQTPAADAVLNLLK